MIDLFDDFYRNKRVLITGHTGFKGAWLAIWLQQLGAEVVGVALDPYSDRDVFCLSGIRKQIDADIRQDIRDGERLKEIFSEYKPEIVFHLAAQPLVRLSYEQPVDTYMTNVIGTINVMEAIRATGSVKAAVMITTDKCYENREVQRGYVEDDPMGGYDPYSSSKGCCELAISSWRRSFFNPKDYSKKHHVSIASVRAGNVIGGGDWSKDRIVPDCIRSIESGKNIEMRSPRAIRPWQHVLEPLSGYMLLACKMWEHPTEYCEGWNFGPGPQSVATVYDLASLLIKHMKSDISIDITTDEKYKEANILMLNTDKVKKRLGWYPRLTFEDTISLTSHWYRNYQKYPEGVLKLCLSEIERYAGSSPIVNS